MASAIHFSRLLPILEHRMNQPWASANAISMYRRGCTWNSTWSTTAALVRPAIAGRTDRPVSMPPLVRGLRLRRARFAEARCRGFLRPGLPGRSQVIAESANAPTKLGNWQRRKDRADRVERLPFKRRSQLLETREGFSRASGTHAARKVSEKAMRRFHLAARRASHARSRHQSSDSAR